MKKNIYHLPLLVMSELLKNSSSNCKNKITLTERTGFFKDMQGRNA